MDTIWGLSADSSVLDRCQMFLNLEVGERKRYLLRKDDLSELVLIVWGPQSQTPIHDHGGSLCSMRVLKGEVVEQVLEKNSLSLLSHKLLTEGMSSQVQTHQVHQLKNESHNLTITLHLYEKPLEGCSRFDEHSRSWISLSSHYDQFEDEE